MVNIRVDDSICVSCGSCASTCPSGLFIVNNEGTYEFDRLNSQRCLGKKCLEINGLTCDGSCPMGAITTDF